MMSRLKYFNNGNAIPRGGQITQPHRRMSHGISYHPIYGYGVHGGRDFEDYDHLKYNLNDNLQEYGMTIDDAIDDNIKAIKSDPERAASYLAEIHVLEHMRANDVPYHTDSELRAHFIGGPGYRPSGQRLLDNSVDLNDIHKAEDDIESNVKNDLKVIRKSEDVTITDYNDVRKFQKFLSNKLKEDITSPFSKQLYINYKKRAIGVLADIEKKQQFAGLLDDIKSYPKSQKISSIVVMEGTKLIKEIDERLSILKSQLEHSKKQKIPEVKAELTKEIVKLEETKEAIKEEITQPSQSAVSMSTQLTQIVNSIPNFNFLITFMNEYVKGYAESNPGPNPLKRFGRALEDLLKSPDPIGEGARSTLQKLRLKNKPDMTQETSEGIVKVIDATKYFFGNGQPVQPIGESTLTKEEKDNAVIDGKTDELYVDYKAYFDSKDEAGKIIKGITLTGSKSSPSVTATVNKITGETGTQIPIWETVDSVPKIVSIIKVDRYSRKPIEIIEPYNPKGRELYFGYVCNDGVAKVNISTLPTFAKRELFKVGGTTQTIDEIKKKWPDIFKDTHIYFGNLTNERLDKQGNIIPPNPKAESNFKIDKSKLIIFKNTK